MATNPPKGLFDPLYYKVQLRPIIEVAVPMIEEVRNYGLAALARCSCRPEGGEENLAPLLSFHHLIEMLDGVQIQLRECSITPAKLLVRSMLEALINIEYVLQKDTVRRGRAFLLMHLLSRLNVGIRTRPDTPEGIKFRKDLGEYGGILNGLPDYDAQIQNLREAIQNRPQLKEVYEEYERLREKTRRVFWYQFFGGPNSIRELAREVGYEAQYVVLYSEMSATGHVQDVIKRLLVLSEGDWAGIRPLRDPTEIKQVILLSVTLAVKAVRVVLTHYRRDEIDAGKISDWYLTEVKPRRDKLLSLKIE